MKSCSVDIDTHSLLYQGIFIEFDYINLTVNWSRGWREYMNKLLIILFTVKAKIIHFQAILALS